MIPQKIQALFDFIDYLDVHKTEYIEKYIPLCDELLQLDTKRSALNPRKNYIEKKQFEKVQKEIEEKFQPITQNIWNPVTQKLKELEIWAGDDTYTSIWNRNMPAIHDFKENFTEEDIPGVIKYKQKYLSFRIETNSSFLCLQIIFSNLDDILKDLFDFFNDTGENEFESFETKTIEVAEFGDALKGYRENKGKNFRFALREESLFNYYNIHQLPQKIQPHIITIKNEITMGDKIQVGDINNSGQIIIGKDIRIADSLNGKNETAGKITELIDLIRKEQNMSDEQKQSLITNFDKVKEEVLVSTPDKSKIFKWLSAAKGILEKLVLTHHVSEAVHWVYTNLNFIIH